MTPTARRVVLVLFENDGDMLLRLQPTRVAWAPSEYMSARTLGAVGISTQ